MQSGFPWDAIWRNPGLGGWGRLTPFQMEESQLPCEGLLHCCQCVHSPLQLSSLILICFSHLLHCYFVLKEL